MLVKHHRSRSLTTPPVLPSFTVGKSLDPIRQGFRSTGGATAQLWKGEVGDFHRMTVRRKSPPLPNPEYNDHPLTPYV